MVQFRNISFVLVKGYPAPPSQNLPCMPAVKPPGAGEETADLQEHSEPQGHIHVIARKFGKDTPRVEPS